MEQPANPPALRRQRCVIGREDKERLVQAHENGQDYYEVAQLLGMKRGTAWGIISRYMRDGEVVVRARGGAQNRKVDAAMRECVVHIVEEHPEFTLNQINQELRAALPDKPHVGVSSVKSMLDGQLITLKKIDQVPQERNRDDVKMACQFYAEWLLKNN